MIESCTKDFFLRNLSYRGFKVFIYRFEHNPDTVTAADVQLSRQSCFPWGLLNRNRPMVKRIVTILEGLYRQKNRSPPFAQLSITQDRVKDDKGWRQFHFGADVACSATTPFEEWGSECAVYDEPCSSGQVDEDETNIRKDFVIIRFRRKQF
jgi:hypothetical protein